MSSKSFAVDHAHAVAWAERLAVIAAELDEGAYAGCDFLEMLESSESKLVETCGRLAEDTAGENGVKRGMKVSNEKWTAGVRGRILANAQARAGVEKPPHSPLPKRKNSGTSAGLESSPVKKRGRAA